MVYARPCRCTGRPLRFEPGQCFTCGRFLAEEIGALAPAAIAHASRPGIAALLEAVDRTRRKMPAPRHNHRRVVIEPKPGPSRALQTVRAQYGAVC